MTILCQWSRESVSCFFILSLGLYAKPGYNILGAEPAGVARPVAVVVVVVVVVFVAVFGGFDRYFPFLKGFKVRWYVEISVKNCEVLELRMRRV